MKWTQQSAVELCRAIEAVCPKYGCHVAMTGGCLYKDGERKDLDLIFYRIRQVKAIDMEGLWNALNREVGLNMESGFGWRYLAKSQGRQVDCLFPEEQKGEYVKL